MKFDFDEFTFQDEISVMNLNRQMENWQVKTNDTMGFNSDTIYQKIQDKWKGVIDEKSNHRYIKKIQR